MTKREDEREEKREQVSERGSVGKDTQVQRSERMRKQVGENTGDALNL